MTGRPAIYALALLAWAPSLNGQVRVGGWVDHQAIGYLSSHGELGRLGRNQVRLQPELDGRLGAWGRAFSAVEFRGDLADPARNRVYLDEAYGDLYLGSLDLRLGRQILQWGRADAINPTDYFGVWDLTDVLDAGEEKLAQDAVRATWFSGRWSVEAVAVPRFRESLIPIPGSRWWPSSDAGPSPDPVDVRLARTAEPPGGRRALSLRASGSSGRFDVAVSAYRGPWHLPVLLPGSPYPDPAGRSLRVDVVPVLGRLSAFGADLATTVGPVGLHGEVAGYRFLDAEAKDPGVEDPFLRYVVGADYTIRGALAERGLFVLVEWIQDLPLIAGAAPWPPDDLNHVFRRSLFTRMTLPTGDFSSLDAQLVYDTDRRGWVLQAEASWQPRDALDLVFSVDVPGGPRDAFFGTFRSNRRIHTRVRYSF